MIYLDYTANTPVDPDVLDVYTRTALMFPGNPNSAHEEGKWAREELDRVTAHLAGELGISPKDIIYTSGATEANNLAIKGTARAARRRGKHIISTPLEHSSVSGSLTALQEQGWEIDLLDIGRDGKVDPEQVLELLRKDTVLVSICAVDSELGTIQPVHEIAKLVHENNEKCVVHVDATQALGKVPFSFEGLDLVSFTAHKFYGLNGAGVLVKKDGIVLEPQMNGGTSTTLYRSGTPDLPGAAALDFALTKILYTDPFYISVLNEKLRTKLNTYDKVQINSPADAVPHILNLSVEGVRGDAFQKVLSEKGVCVSVKSACSVPGTPSRPVFAVSRDRKRALNSWRISLGKQTTDAELDEFLSIFDECYRTLTNA